MSATVTETTPIARGETVLGGILASPDAMVPAVTSASLVPTALVETSVARDARTEPGARSVLAIVILQGAIVLEESLVAIVEMENVARAVVEKANVHAENPVANVAMETEIVEMTTGDTATGMPVEPEAPTVSSAVAEPEAAVAVIEAVGTGSSPRRNAYSTSFGRYGRSTTTRRFQTTSPRSICIPVLGTS